MARCGKGSTFGKWGIIAGGIAGGALISLIPVIKKRAMRVTTILKKDHRMVSGLIATLHMAPKVNGAVRKTLFDRIHHSLLVHTQAEEEILYPAMRNFMLMDSRSNVDESYREHAEIRNLLNELARMDPVSDAFDTKLEELKGDIEHHVNEEENEMFEILTQRMSVERQQELGRQIHERKLHLKTRIAA